MKAKRMLAGVLAAALMLTVMTAAGAEEKTIRMWGEWRQDGTMTISNLVDTVVDEYGNEEYVLDTNSTVTLNTALDYLEIIDGSKEYDAEGYFLFRSETDSEAAAPCMLLQYGTATRMDEESRVSAGLVPVTYVQAGTTIQFTEPGIYGIWMSLGYESMEQRMATEEDETNGLGWQMTPGFTFRVVAPGSYEAVSGDASSEAIPAYYTTSSVLVNGQRVDFEAYNINDNNYFKLRDVALALAGTDKEFEVVWNSEAGAVDILPGQTYTEVGGELAGGDGADKTAINSPSRIAINGGPAELTVYMVNDNNYFKLRDLGQALDFEVAWDAANDSIIIDTGKAYTGEDIAAAS